MVKIFFGIISIILIILWYWFYKQKDAMILQEFMKIYLINANFEMMNLKQKLIDNREKIQNASKIKKFVIKLNYNEKDVIKKYNKFKKSIEDIRKNPVKILKNNEAILGLILMKKFDISPENMTWYKDLITKFSTIHNKKDALSVVKYKIARFISLMILSCIFSFSIGAVLSIFAENTLFIVLIIPLITGVLLYDELYRLKKKSDNKQDEIERNFPNIVSQLALLVGAGMNINSAWSKTALSFNSALNNEMKLVIKEIDNGISSYQAYDNFIKRCNNKYTSKLALAIMQNIDKGNDKINELLIGLTNESWYERQNYAKRKGTIAEGKLIFPIVLMFLSIIILTIAPTVIQFTSYSI